MTGYTFHFQQYGKKVSKDIWAKNIVAALCIMRAIYGSDVAIYDFSYIKVAERKPTTIYRIYYYNSDIEPTQWENIEASNLAIATCIFKTLYPNATILEVEFIQVSNLAFKAS